MFFDCSEYNILTHNLNKQNDIWLTLVDEIINYKMVCQFKIDDKVNHFFLNNPHFIKIEQNEFTYYESPIVAYIGCNIKKRDFISTFGQILANDGLYHFTGFEKVFIDNNNKRSGLIRFAIFLGNMAICSNIKEVDWDIYDSIYLDGTWILKDYNKQIVLTSHLRENDKLYII